MLLFVFIGSVVLTAAGAFALVHADRRATPEADPMAANQQSPKMHRWIHHGAIVLTGFGVLLLVFGLIAAANYTA